MPNWKDFFNDYQPQTREDAMREYELEQHIRDEQKEGK